MELGGEKSGFITRKTDQPRNDCATGTHNAHRDDMAIFF